MKIILSSASFLPSYGGPAYSVSNLALHLAAIGVEVAIWAGDGSAPLSPAMSVQTVRGSLRALDGSLKRAVDQFGWPNLFHDSGLWWRHNRAIASLGQCRNIPVIISPRGMLEPSALRHRKWRKRLAWTLYQKAILDQAVRLHATSELELMNLRALSLRPEIVCIPNGLIVPNMFPERSAEKIRRVVFLGRLHPIKGLPMLIEAWARVRPVNWLLEIAGPDEAGHRRRLEEQVKSAALESRVCFVGPVSAAERKKLLARASIFVLPSHSENFGIAAGEALAEGIPVIATHGTPWAALESEGCGWHVPTSPDGLEAGLRNALSAPTEQLIEMGRRGHAYVARTFSWDTVAEEMFGLYRRVLE